jgi:hypothetical protein
MSNEAIARSGNTGVVTEQTSLNTFDLAAIGAAAVVIQALAVPGVVPGDQVILTPKADIADCLILPGYCLVAGTARFPSYSVGGVNPASQSFDVTILKKVG